MILMKIATVQFEEINPFVRFCAKQTFFMESFWAKEEVVNLDHRIYYCQSGEADLLIDGKSHHLKPKTLVLWQAGHRYKCVPTGGERCACFTCNFDFTSSFRTLKTPIAPIRVADFRQGMVLECVRFSDYDPFNQIVYVENFNEGEDIFPRMREIYNADLKYAHFELKTAFCQLLIAVKDATLWGESKNAKSRAGMQIIDFIKAHYRENLSNADVAKAFSYHPNYVSVLIGKETGCSLHNFLIKYRLRKAIGYLNTSTMSIREICEAVNIPDPRYFSRLFKKYYGYCPTEARGKAGANILQALDTEQSPTDFGK